MTNTKNLLSIVILMILFSLETVGQKETAPKLNVSRDTTLNVDLLGEINKTVPDKSVLLPNKIMFTQRIFWGEKGLMRTFNAFELTPEKREHELKIRRTMLVTHQVMGMLTLGGMIAQGFVGAKLYNQQKQGIYDENLKNTHKAIAKGIEIGYFTTASLSLFAPPKMLNERKGYSSIKLHRILAMIHFSGMITTMILANQLEENSDLKPWHRAAAYTTFGAFAASMIVIKF